MKRKNKIFLGCLIGAFAILFIPMIPVWLPNTQGQYLFPQGLWWNSGLMQLPNLFHFFLIEGIGAGLGFLFCYPLIKEDKNA